MEGRQWWGGHGLSRFIPASMINDVIINEAIYRVCIYNREKLNPQKLIITELTY